MSASATIFGRDSAIFKVTNFLGLGIPGWLDKQFAGEQPTLRLGDISRQTAKEGESRTIVWGRVRAIGGNIIHCQEPQIRVVKQKVEGGKGGGGDKEQKVEKVFRTYAIGVCEGPVTGFIRIWRNNKLVYDARGNDWGTENNPVFLEKFRLYTGAYNQMPAPELEAIWGVGDVPAYRGTAYMVADDEDLTDFGGGVPQWLFEVERAQGIFLTSRPYPVEVVESAEPKNFSAKESPSVYYTEVAENKNFEIIAGDFGDGFNLIEYEDGLAEWLEPSWSISAGSLDVGFKLIEYEDGLPESLDSAWSLIAGDRRPGLVFYGNGQIELLEVTDFSLMGGSHDES